MKYAWYDLDWDGLLNPLVMVLVLVVVGVLWSRRLLSNRTFVALNYIAALAYVLHFDRVAYVTGLRNGLQPPMEGWAPWGVRALLYALGSLFLFWGGWGWTKSRYTPEALAQTRGIAYIRERRRDKAEAAEANERAD